MHTEEKPINGVLEEFRLAWVESWPKLPNKLFFLCLLVAWMALFLLLGNATLGYVKSSSLIAWMLNAYHPAGDYLGAEEGHAVLIPFVVLALFWWKRKRLLTLQLRTWSPALVIVAIALLLHILGYTIQQPRLSVLGMFLGIYGLMGVAWGPAWLKESFFPYFLFLFCIPLGALAQPITFRLRLLVCQMVELISHQVLAIDVIREGTVLMDSSGRFSYGVEAACSGLKSQIATFGIAVVYAFVSFRSWWKRGVMILSAFPLAVLGNFLRLMAIILAADLWGQDAGQWVHDGGPGGIISLIPYIPAFIGLFYIGSWLERIGGDSPSTPKTPSDLPGLEQAPKSAETATP